MKQSHCNIIKNIIDKVVATVGLFFCSFLFLFIVICIKLDSKGKAVFKQERIGKNEKLFHVYKFRTMKSADIPFDVNRAVIDTDDENLTRVGKVIRRFKLDELLQLLNVLKGDMSLVGPRPLMSVYLPMYEMWERQKFLIKPGMSGLAQVKGNGYLSVAERSYYDIMYIKNHSCWMDTEILLKTMGVVLFGEKKYLQNVPMDEIERVKKEYFDNL